MNTQVASLSVGLRRGEREDLTLADNEQERPSRALSYDGSETEMSTVIGQITCCLHISVAPTRGGSLFPTKHADG